MIEETVPAALEGERIDRVVSMITGCSRSAAVALVLDDGVRRNGRRVKKASERVELDDTVLIDDTKLVAEPAPAPDAGIEIAVVHEDDDVLVIDKQPGMVVHPGAGTPDGTLVNALLARYPELAEVGDSQRPGIVHRLDKGTSGLLMVARTEAALENLGEQLAARTVERLYHTVAWGHPEADRGLIDAPIGRSRRQPTRMAVQDDGREARTRYEVLLRAVEPAEVSLLHCRLETGRTHQIRVHCRAIGHPVVGDDLYGGRRAGLPFDRPALHAAVLGFRHPVSNEMLRFEAPPPPDLAELIDSLR